MRRIANPAYVEALRLRTEDRLVAPSISKITAVPLSTIRKWLKGRELSKEEICAHVIIASANKPPRQKKSEIERREAKLQSGRKWFANNKETQRNCVKRRRDRLVEWLRELKSHLRCSSCPETHPACLDFHHKNDDKEIDVTEMIRRGRSKKNIEMEIAKCDVICSNCHRKIHWKERQDARIAQADRAAHS